MSSAKQNDISLKIMKIFFYESITERQKEVKIVIKRRSYAIGVCSIKIWNFCMAIT